MWIVVTGTSRPMVVHDYIYQDNDPRGLRGSHFLRLKHPYRVFTLPGTKIDTQTDKMASLELRGGIYTAPSFILGYMPIYWYLYLSRSLSVSASGNVNAPLSPR